MKRTRIYIIRTAILAEGGNNIKRGQYYADGPNSYTASNSRDEVVYKVPKHLDGLDVAARDRVVEDLNNDSDVKHAYLSRPERIYSRGVYVQSGPHLKVVFQGVISKNSC